MIVQIVYISERASKKIYDKLVESGKDLHNRQVKSTSTNPSRSFVPRHSILANQSINKCLGVHGESHTMHAQGFSMLLGLKGWCTAEDCRWPKVFIYKQMVSSLVPNFLRSFAMISKRYLIVEKAPFKTFQSHKKFHRRSD